MLQFFFDNSSLCVVVLIGICLSCNSVLQSKQAWLGSDDEILMIFRMYLSSAEVADLFGVVDAGLAVSNSSWSHQIGFEPNAANQLANTTCDLVLTEQHGGASRTRMALI